VGSAVDPLGTLQVRMVWIIRRDLGGRCHESVSQLFEVTPVFDSQGRNLE